MNSNIETTKRTKMTAKRIRPYPFAVVLVLLVFVLVTVNSIYPGVNRTVFVPSAYHLGGVLGFSGQCAAAQ